MLFYLFRSDVQFVPESVKWTPDRNSVAQSMKAVGARAHTSSFHQRREELNVLSIVTLMRYISLHVPKDKWLYIARDYIFICVYLFYLYSAWKPWYLMRAAWKYGVIKYFVSCQPRSHDKSEKLFIYFISAVQLLTPWARALIYLFERCT